MNPLQLNLFQTMSPEPAEDVAEEILDYLHSHPNAKDTVEGITTWWLKDRPQHIVEKALNDLVLKRDIKVTRASDGRKHYSAHHLHVGQC